MSTPALEFTLNGERIRLEGASPNTPLLDWLRASGRTGSKEGCAEGDCGACSVAMIDADAEGRPVWRAFNSCLTPLALVHGRELVTVEGLAGEQLHPVQQCMVANHGSQCGYCTPGIIMSMFEGYYRDDLKQDWQLNDQLCGNLCRCTGYRPIRQAALEAWSLAEQAADDRFGLRLREVEAVPSAASYAHDGQKFFRPASLEELFSLQSAHSDARLIAGATELGLEISKRFKRFPVLISTESVPELRRLEKTAHAWHIGGAVTLTQLGDAMADDFPLWAKMLWVFGSRQIRNRATLGGNLVTASPIGDSAPVLLALDAELVLASLRGRRTVSIADFFLGYRKTELAGDEVLLEVVVPVSPPALGHTRKRDWFKVSKRREMDISTVSGCFSVEADAAGLVTKARLAFGGVAATPARARRAEECLLGKKWNEETVAEAGRVLAGEFSPISDARGSADYRAGVIRSLLVKFFHEAAWSEETAALPVPVIPADRPLPHESAHKHVNGEAVYTDDVALRRQNALEVWPVHSPHALARIVRRDAAAARNLPGIRAVLMAEDVPGVNDVGAVRPDEELLADQLAQFHGHIVALVVGDTADQCRAAAAQVVVEYEPLDPVLTIEQAIAAGSFHSEPNFMRRGDVLGALGSAPHVLEGDFSLGGQEHFYLEMQAAFAEPGEDDTVQVTSSTQHPTEVQHLVAHVLGVAAHEVVVKVPRMGGGFGGKETQAATLAALSALAAKTTGRPVRMRFNRDQDMMLTGKRHPFLARFTVGYDEDGRLLGLKAALFSNGGWALDLSMPVTDRAMFHADNCYYIPHVEIAGRVVKTNLVSNTAFRGFGGPQGMLIIEEILDRVARQLGLPPEVVRERNLYHGTGETNTTHYGQAIEDNRIQQVWHELKKSADLTARRAEIAAWNASSPHRKRGLAMTPVKFGISFTNTMLNQAGALVLVYSDGSAQVNHGGTEMGQGINTNIIAIAAHALGLTTEKIRVMSTATDKVPNTSATAASSGTDMNGMAVQNACETILARLRPVAAELLSAKHGRPFDAEDLQFRDGRVFHPDYPENFFEFSQVTQTAWMQRISLSATGFYRTPEIHWDRAAGQGNPFYYFAIGAAVSEVEVDEFTGEMQVRRVDILQDAGNSLNEGINRGQVEGGFIQGMGWLTVEELVWNAEGKLLTHSPDTYKIPAVGDMPRDFRVRLLENAPNPKATIHRTKAVGEPPFMLAISVREAIREAVAAFGPGGRQVRLASPATGEAIYRAIRDQQMPDVATDPAEAGPRGVLV
ncbi:MAG: xanthine dehydrogenase molybdopterin binding subunit [Chthoniobacterales bacterium]